MRTRRPRSAPLPRSVFAGFRFPPDVIVLMVRWYLRDALSYRDVEELLTERGIEVDHVTVYRWVQRFTLPLADAANAPASAANANKLGDDHTPAQRRRPRDQTGRTYLVGALAFETRVATSVRRMCTPGVTPS